MSSCRTCAAQIEAGATKCSQCGTPIAPENQIKLQPTENSSGAGLKTFFCFATDQAGKKYAGEISAKDKAEAEGMLKAESYVIQTLYEKHSKEDPVVRKKVQESEVVLFYATIAAIIGIGIAIYFLVK